MPKQIGDPKFVTWLQETMMMVAPPKYKVGGQIVIPEGVDLDLFYETLCSQACLRSNSKDVRQAFGNLLPPVLYVTSHSQDDQCIYKTKNKITVDKGSLFIIQLERE